MTWDVIGHAWAVSLLQLHLASGEVRHAYLFTGPPGIGKRTLALRFAQAMLCQRPPAGGESCGECRACRLVRGEVHPDLHLLRRSEGKSEIGIEQIRDLQHRLALSPLEAAHRVALLIDFHDASDSASNALLKTLEEPSGGAVLLLTAAAAESVLPTIASRCETIALRPVRSEEVEAGLRAGGAQEKHARLIASLASGRPGWALTAMTSPGLLEARDQALGDLARMLGTSRANRFAFVEGIHQDRERVQRTLEAWLSLWRDVMVTGHGAESRLGNLDRKEWVQSLALQVGAPQARTAALAVERTLAALERHANSRLALEVLMLDLPGLRST